MQETLLTTEQVARYLNVDKFTVYRLVVQKKLSALPPAERQTPLLPSTTFKRYHVLCEQGPFLVGQFEFANGGTLFFDEIGERSVRKAAGRRC